MNIKVFQSPIFDIYWRINFKIEFCPLSDLDGAMLVRVGVLNVIRRWGSLYFWGSETMASFVHTLREHTETDL